MAGAAKLVLSLHPSSFVSADATLRGNITIGPKCFIHPKAVLDAGQGTIVIGSGVLIEECASIVNQTTKPLSIGNNNWIRVGAVVQCLAVGNGNILEVQSFSSLGATIGNGCVLGIRCALSSEQELADGTCVSRVNQALVRNLRPANEAIDEHFEALQMQFDFLFSDPAKCLAGRH